jgi:hypothetical protein
LDIRTGFLERQYPGEALVTINGKPGKVMADQIMASDKARLKNQLGILSKTDMLAVEDAILVHLAMPRQNEKKPPQEEIVHSLNRVSPPVDA